MIRKTVKNIAPIRNDIGPIRNKKIVFPHDGGRVYERIFFLNFQNHITHEKMQLKFSKFFTEFLKKRLPFSLSGAQCGLSS